MYVFSLNFSVYNPDFFFLFRTHNLHLVFPEMKCLTIYYSTFISQFIFSDNYMLGAYVTLVSIHDIKAIFMLHIGQYSLWLYNCTMIQYRARYCKYVLFLFSILFQSYCFHKLKGHTLLFKVLFWKCIKTIS